jgi:hypothetical protein
VKTRIDDCIYCGKPARSGEHVLAAGLGGRRTNKSILCRPCDAGFSDLDQNLIEQLSPIRGLIGVRPDHRDAPVPAQVQMADGVLLVDGAGRPSWQTPRLRSETLLPDGSTMVIVEANESQLQEWREMMRRHGIDARIVNRNAGQRFLQHPAGFAWSFGGEEALREIARIALNFVADQHPHIARLPALHSAKQWIRGERVRTAPELPIVWINDGMVHLPPCSFEFGHRVGLRLSARSGELVAVVSFFDTFEYVVSFGAVGVDCDAVVVIDVDPLAEHPPNDRVIVTPAIDPFLNLTRAGSSDATEAQCKYVRGRFLALVKRIEDLQARRALGELLPKLNAVRDLHSLEHRDAIMSALDECNGYVFKLARRMHQGLARSAVTPNDRWLADAFGMLLEFDAATDDGLTRMARSSLFLARSALAAELARELQAGPLTRERLMLLLNGGPGATIVFRALMQPIMLHLGVHDGW